MMDPGGKTCTCGSNLWRHELLDAAGLFCGYVCDQCEDDKRAQFNPTIFESGTPYAMTGEEEDLFIDREG